MTAYQIYSFDGYFKAIFRLYRNYVKTFFPSSKCPHIVESTLDWQMIQLLNFLYIFIYFYTFLYIFFNFLNSYPMNWYMDITTNPKFHSLAAILNNKLVGLLVAEIKSQSDCNLEDQNLLSRRFDRSTKVVYILVLGVVSEHRRKGMVHK